MFKIYFLQIAFLTEEEKMSKIENDGCYRRKPFIFIRLGFGEKHFLHLSFVFSLEHPMTSQINLQILHTVPSNVSGVNYFSCASLSRE